MSEFPNDPKHADIVTVHKKRIQNQPNQLNAS